jgi:hypothetical protein
MECTGLLPSWQKATNCPHIVLGEFSLHQGRGVHVTGVSTAYTFKLNKNILSE